MIGVTATQPLGFVVCCVLGLVMGILYAALTPVRRRRKTRIGVFLMDILFWILAAGAFTAGLYFATKGVLRTFCILAFVLGFAVALTGPGYYIIKMESCFLKWLDKKKLEAKANRMEEDE
mgnify:FL=1